MYNFIPVLWCIPVLWSQKSIDQNVLFCKICIFDFPPNNTVPPFLWISPKKNPFRLDKQLVLCLQRIIVIHIMHNRILYMILILPRHSYIYDPDSSPSLSYIWSWFFSVAILYMILNLPLHCLIYDPDFSPSLSYIWSWFFPVTLIYDPESSPSLSYIWSWFFPVTVLYTGMILNLPRHCLIYDPDSSPSCTVLYMILILPRQYLIVHENRRYTYW